KKLLRFCSKQPLTRHPERVLCTPFFAVPIDLTSRLQAGNLHVSGTHRPLYVIQPFDTRAHGRRDGSTVPSTVPQARSRHGGFGNGDQRRPPVEQPKVAP